MDSYKLLNLKKGKKINIEEAKLNYINIKHQIYEMRKKGDSSKFDEMSKMLDMAYEEIRNKYNEEQEGEIR